MRGRDRTGTEVEAARSSVGSTSVPSTQGAARAGGLGPQGPHKPQSRGQNPGPPPTPIATAETILVWRGHRLRARSWHASLIAQVRAGRPVAVAHERTVCGIDLPDHVITSIEVDGEVSCAGCAGYARADHRLAVSKEEAVAA